MKILFAEFQLIKGFLQPTSITTFEKKYSRHYDKELCRIEEYYVDYSRAGDELMIKNAGCGGGIPLEVSLCPFVDEHRLVIYYADASKALIKANGTKSFRLDKLPPHLTWMLDRDKWEGFGNGQPWRTEVDDTISCSVCNDFFPDSNHCDHIFWSRDIGWWAGCGADELQDVCKESLFVFLKGIGRKKARKLRRILASHNYHIYKALGGGMTKEPLDYLPDSQRDDAEDGYGWLLSLESGKTREADMLTVSWIGEWLKVDGAKR